MAELTTFLMFEGNAEEAMEFYVSVFPNASIDHLERYGADQGGQPGTVRQAAFSLNGQRFLCIDSPVRHEFGFTPAVSIHVRCESAEEVGRLYEALSQGGQVLMPLDEYPFSQKYGWVSDRFGLSWQLQFP